MCKTKAEGGRRCYSHSRSKLAAARQSYAKFEHAQQSEPSETSERDRLKLLERVERSAINFAATERGARELEAELETIGKSPIDDEEYYEYYAWYDKVLRLGRRKRLADLEEGYRLRRETIAKETGTPPHAVHAIYRHLQEEPADRSHQQIWQDVRRASRAYADLPPLNDLGGRDKAALAVAVGTGRTQIVKWYPQSSSGDGFIFSPTGEYRWGVYGAAGVLMRHVDEQGTPRFFLAQRGANVSGGAGTWAFPGGGLDEGETPLTGGLREFEEELHVPINDVHVHGSHENNAFPGWTYSTLCVDTEDPIDVAKTRVDWETTNRGWFTEEEIRQMPLHPALEANLETLFRKFPTSH